jgi:hypothetical protein
LETSDKADNTDAVVLAHQRPQIVIPAPLFEFLSCVITPPFRVHLNTLQLFDFRITARCQLGIVFGAVEKKLLPAFAVTVTCSSSSSIGSTNSLLIVEANSQDPSYDSFFLHVRIVLR